MRWSVLNGYGLTSQYRIVSGKRGASYLLREEEDIVCSPWRHGAGVIAHRVHLTNVLDKRFDGDTVSVIAAYSDNSVAESKEYFRKREAYIQAGGGLAFSCNIHTLKLTMAFLTGEPIDE